jgi:integrase
MAVEDTWHRRDGSRSSRYGRGLRYRVRWGRRGQARSFRTKGEAERYWLKIRTEQPEPDRPDDLVGELVDRWLATKRGLSPRGFEACRDAARIVRADLGGRVAADLTREEVQAWIGGLQAVVWQGAGPDRRRVARPASASLRHKAYQCLAGALQLAGLTACDGVKVPKQRGRDSRFLTAPELQQLALAAGDSGVMVLLLGLTGMRIGEACALNVGDVDPARHRLRVRKSKNGRPRDVPIHGALLARLDLDRPAGDPLLLSPTGRRVIARNWRERVFRPAADRAGLGPVRVHDLRHTAASLAIAAGADVKTVQAMLGHRSAVMTLDLYGHLFDRSLDDVAGRMGAMLGWT